MRYKVVCETGEIKFTPELLTKVDALCQNKNIPFAEILSALVGEEPNETIVSHSWLLDLLEWQHSYVNEFEDQNPFEARKKAWSRLNSYTEIYDGSEIKSLNDVSNSFFSVKNLHDHSQLRGIKPLVESLSLRFNIYNPLLYFIHNDKEVLLASHFGYRNTYFEEQKILESYKN